MYRKGFEPPTHGLEGRCSIQLSYRYKPILAISQNESGWWESNPRIQLGRLVFYHWTTPARKNIYLCLFTKLRNKSGWQDSNLRPLDPKSSTLAKLSHTPKFLKCFAIKQGILYMNNSIMSTLFWYFYYFRIIWFIVYFIYWILIITLILYLFYNFLKLYFNIFIFFNWHLYKLVYIIINKI